MPHKDLRITYEHQDFEWDLQKSRENIEKHTVGFDEAMTVFSDPNQHTLKTEYKDETVFNIIGTSQQLRQTVVVHCERGQRNVIRIIGARRPESWEVDEYIKNIARGC